MHKVNSFEEKAAQLGHDIDALNAGEEISTVINIEDVDSFKTLMQDENRLVEQREQEAVAAFGELPPAANNTKAALQQRVNHFVYGNYELTEADKKAANATLFPMKALAISAKNKTINEPLLLGSEQLPLFINYGTLNLGDEAYITVEGVGLKFTIAIFTRTGSAPTTMGDFNLLGRKGQDGCPGRPGGTGPNGAPGINGGNGGNGSDGSDGSMGIPSQQSTISITESIQSPRPIVVYTSSGAGGKGGRGGDGGRGGNGGAGAKGGTGGTGGKGGNGANGVNAAGNILIYVAAPYINQITGITAVAPAGAGGQGGDGGNGGGGSTSGQHGDNGAAGNPGANTGTPAQIIIRPY